MLLEHATPAIVGSMPDCPAETAGLAPLELEVLRTVNARPVRTVREVVLAIGRLGGHLNRRQDGLPGWQTLWRGMKKLALLVRGCSLGVPNEQTWGMLRPVRRGG